MPPSAITGTPAFCAAFAASITAVSCGTPTPATIRVVQIEPGPMPTFTASAPASISALAPSAVATLPAMICVLLDARLMRLDRLAARLWNGRARCRSRRHRRPLRSAPASARSPHRQSWKPRRRSKRPRSSLARFGKACAFSKSFTVMRPMHLVRLVDDDHALDPVLVQQLLGLALVDAVAHRDEIRLRHQVGDALVRVRQSACRGW